MYHLSLTSTSTYFQRLVDWNFTYLIGLNESIRVPLLFPGLLTFFLRLLSLVLSTVGPQRPGTHPCPPSDRPVPALTPRRSSTFSVPLSKTGSWRSSLRSTTMELKSGHSGQSLKTGDLQILLVKHNKTKTSTQSVFIFSLCQPNKKDSRSEQLSLWQVLLLGTKIQNKTTKTVSSVDWVQD